MSRTSALREAQKLQKIVESYGVKCTIELQIGRPWGGDDWYSDKHVLMNHHTAGPRTGLTPSLAICKNGRSDVPGPLCNGYGGRDKVFRILTMGLANHPGAGGPLTVAGVRLPRNSARISSFGIEWEHTGIHAWPADMLEFMGKVGAAVLDYLSRPTEASIEHSTWTPRKIDRNNFSRSGSTGRTLITKYRGKGGSVPEPEPEPKPEEEIDMFITRYGSSVYYLFYADGSYRGLTAAEYSTLEKAGVPVKSYSSAVVDILRSKGVRKVPLISGGSLDYTTKETTLEGVLSSTNRYTILGQRAAANAERNAASALAISRANAAVLAKLIDNPNVTVEVIEATIEEVIERELPAALEETVIEVDINVNQDGS